MKHQLKQQFQHFLSHRPYQVAAASAAAVVLASTTGALLTGAEEAAARPDSALVASAELARPTEKAASRGQARVAATPSTGTASARPDPDLTGKPAPAAKPTAAKAPASKVLRTTYQAQTTYYNCGPAAVRNALSAKGIERSQAALAGPLGTTEMGTNSAEDTTRVLNDVLGKDVYQTRTISGQAATPAQMDRLQADVVETITSGYAVVANVAGSATDTAGGWHSFPGGHYIAVVGYGDEGRTVRISDSADPSASSYWMTTIGLANWIATRGYSA